MTEISHLLRPGGWRMTFKNSKNKVCSELLPDTGTTILIGLPSKGKGCNVVWMDRKGVLRTITNFVPKEDHWEAKVKYENDNYIVTVGEKPVAGASTPPAIVGNVLKVQGGRVTASAGKIRRPPDPYEVQGTWGAEANSGGGKG
ncbi:MAG TPA: hypothetical protein VF179_28595 [Thermoanaerobaculia bacterium]|nr:hypothetical protein [Thermoanaerobaculia bacterium]